MDEPGGLHDLGAAGRAAWDETIAACLLTAIDSPAAHPYLRPAPDDSTPHSTAIDWTGFPVRVAACIGRQVALEVLDTDRSLQEEYVEWRVVRDRGRRIRRVELTTELRDLWLVLAAHEPARTLELVGELTGRAVKPSAVYGLLDPLAVAPEDRARAFQATMIDRPNQLNDGRRGICFMKLRSNDLLSLVTIAVAAAHPSVTRDSATRPPRPATAGETIPLLGKAAMAGRASDPVIVERLGRLAYEGRAIAIDDPPGVYIDGVERTRLRTPAGEVVPAEWFVTSRGGQRLVLEVPASERFAVGDLVDAATERRIAHGGQIAELVQLRLRLRTSDAGAVRSRDRLEPPALERTAVPCEDIREHMASQVA